MVSTWFALLSVDSHHRLDHDHDHARVTNRIDGVAPRPHSFPIPLIPIALVAFFTRNHLVPDGIEPSRYDVPGPVCCA